MKAEMDIITGRIKQYYVVSSVNSSSFQQSCSDLLCSLVQLRTRGCAHCYTLKAKARRVSVQNGLTKWSVFMGVVCVSPLNSAAYRGHDQDQSVLSTAGLQTGTDAVGQKRTDLNLLSIQEILALNMITGDTNQLSIISANSITKPANKKWSKV